jgi:hypothetical protein
MHEVIEFLSRRRECEWPAVEQLHAEFALQLEKLAADGRLLDAERHLVDRGGDPLVFRNMIEQFEMVDVHAR